VKTKTSTAPVLLDELVLRCNGSRETVDTWLQKFRVTPTTDWAGRSTIPADVAERILKALRQSAADHAEAVSAYDAYTKDRERRLMEAGDRAYTETVERELEAQYHVKYANSGPDDRRGFAEGGVTYTNALT
jgi:hypothetical protein